MLKSKAFQRELSVFNIVLQYLTERCINNKFKYIPLLSVCKGEHTAKCKTKYNPNSVNSQRTLFLVLFPIKDSLKS